MKNPPRVSFAVALLCAGFANAASGATGPTQTPLKVVQTYVKNTNGMIYIAFNTGSMPGCYANSGGYLQPTNPYFKELYAQVLMLIANGGVRGSVIYTQNTPTNNWNDCYIDGIQLLPE